MREAGLKPLLRHIFLYDGAELTIFADPATSECLLYLDILLGYIDSVVLVSPWCSVRNSKYELCIALFLLFVLVVSCFLVSPIMFVLQ